MARHTGGWVKLWRKASLGDIGSNYTRGGLFGALISMANIQNSKVSWKGKPRILERGEIVTSYKELAELGEVDRSTVVRHMNYLQLRGTLTIEKSNKGILVKVLNYEQYQGVDADGPHEESYQAPHPTHIRHHIDPTHNEEVKNKRNKETTRPVVEKSTPVHIDSAEQLLDLFDDKRMLELRELYPDEGFIKREAIKAVQYYRDNPKKLPKTSRGWKTAFSSWLNRSWRYHVKTIPSSASNGPSNIDWSQFKHDEVGA